MRTRAIVTLAGLSAVLLVGAACTRDGPGTDGGDASPGGGLSTPGMHRIDPPPLGTRHGEARALAGDQLLVWGGQTAENSMEGRTLGDGAVLDVRTGRWSRVDPSPFPHGLFSPAAAFDGVEVVVVGTECDETIPAPTLGVPPECRGPAAAAWDPTDGSWRRLTAPPLTTGSLGVPGFSPSVQTAGGDGRAVFVDTYPLRSIAWDRRDGSWTTVDPPVDVRADAWSWPCADPSRPWVVAIGAADDPGVQLLAVLRPDGSPWTTPVRSDAPGDASSCGGGRVVTSGWDGLTAVGSVVDPLTGTTESAFEGGSDTPTQAAASGEWMFVRSADLTIAGSTTTAAGPAAGPELWTDRPMTSVRLLPDGPLVPAGTRSNLFGLTGRSASYVGTGIVMCELALPDRCRMWVPPAAATAG